MKLIYSLMLYIIKGIRFILICVIIITIFGLVKPYISDASSYSYLNYPMYIDKQINVKVKYFIPTQVAGRDASRIITIIMLLIIAAVAKDFENVVNRRKMKSQLDNFKNSVKSTSQLEIIKKIEEGMDSPNYSKSKNRKELLNEFVRLKQELEKAGRSLSFLSIDVVDSMGMKKGEELEVIERDFNEYHTFIVNKFIKHGYLKASWTPDGVMACFNTTEQAVDTARDIIISLQDFNKIKMMKADFHVRCGINSGFVYYDLSTPLEEFSDRVIDIAGHMQKQADIDSIFIAKSLVKPIQSYRVFNSYQHPVDGLEVCKWNITPK